MPLYEKFVGRSRDDFASLEDLNRNYKVRIHDDFNYGFDVIDVLAAEKPDGLAMMWVGANGEERR